jgi:lipase chaperone LimK
MRDIRSDLQERANIIEEQIRAAYAHFEKAIQQLQNERDARVADLQGSHAMLNKLIEFEARFMENVVPLSNPEAPRLSLADRIKAASG